MNCYRLNESIQNKIENVMEGRKTEKSVLEPTYFKSIYSPATLLNDWYDKRNEPKQESTAEPIISENMDSYRQPCQTSVPDRREMFNRIFENYGLGQKLLIDHQGLAYYDNYVTTYDLMYNHFTKGICGPYPRRYYKGHYKPELDLTRIYGNLTQWGLKENVYAQIKTFEESGVCMPVTETTSEPPRSSARSAPIEEYFPRMEVRDFFTSSDLEIAEVDTIFLNSQTLAPFCISSSQDNKILVTVEGGVFVFELWPTPVSEKSSITFLKFWIPSSTSTPLSNAVVENENGSFLWSLDRKQACEAVIDSTLSHSVQRPNSCAVFSYFVRCEFSPLIGNRSYLSCLTNTGVLEIYKNQLKKWVPVINVTELWILHCNFKADVNNMDFNTFKTRMYQLKISTMKWVREPEIKFITGHENGMIVFWNVISVNNDLNINVQFILCVNEKPECLQLHSILDCKNVLLIIGFPSGVVKCLTISIITGERESEVTLWENRDFIVPSLMLTKTVFNKLFVHIVKRHIILLQSLLVSTNKLELVMTKWEEFSTAITGWHEYQDMFILSLQNHDMYMVMVKEDNDKQFVIDTKPIAVELKAKQKASYGSFGLAMSQNKAFWILVSSSRVNYDSPKGMTYLTIYSPKLKIFKSLSDPTASGLLDKILEKYEDVELNEIFDLVELKKLELFKDNSKFCENYKIQGNTSLLKLQLMLWEIKLKFHSNLIESESPVTEIECSILKTYAKKVVEDLERLGTLSPVEKKSLDVCQMFLRDDRNRTNLIHETCPICGSECVFYSTRILSCPGNHKFPRCCLSLLPCDVVPYAFCRLCDAVALLSFVSENNCRCPYCDGLLESDSRLLSSS